MKDYGGNVMTVTDEAKLFAIRTQLLEMRFKLDASINIINYVFEREQDSSEIVTVSLHCDDDNPVSGPIDGLYPGQKPDVREPECEEADLETCEE